MKNYLRLLTIFVLLITGVSGYAQDIITTVSGRVLEVKITEMAAKKIYFKMYGSADVPVQEIARSQVAAIQYGKDSPFDVPDSSTQASGGAANATEMARQGHEDALENYHRSNGAWTGTFLLTAAGGGILGLIPAIACSNTPPAECRLDYPDAALMENITYRIAYTNTAKKMKQRKVWGAYGIGILTAVVGAVLVSVATGGR